MSLLTPISLTLTQNKVVTGSPPRTGRFAVQSSIVANPLTLDGQSNPAGLVPANAFIITKDLGVDQERFYRMLDLSKSEDLAYPINPLDCFTDLAVNLSTAPVGGTLRIRGQVLSAPGAPELLYGLPGEWVTDPAQLPGPADFEILEVLQDQRLRVSGRFMWAARDLHWEVLDAEGNLTGLSGTAGVTQRQQLNLEFWRDRHFTAGFYEMSAALDHITLVQTHVKSITKQANSDAATYLAWPPSNPIVTTY